MKKFLSLFIGATMVATLCTGCGNKTSDKENPQLTTSENNTEQSQQPAEVYTPGTITDKVYKNECLKLKYTPVEKMGVADKEELKSLKNKMELALRGLETLCSEYNVEFFGTMTEYKTNTFIEVISAKLVDKNMTESEILRMESIPYKTEQTAYSSYKIGDVEFSKSSNLKVKGFPCTILLKKFGDHYVMILTMADDDKKFDKMLSGFSKL